MTGTSLGADLTKLTNIQGRAIEVEVLELKDGKVEMMLGNKRIYYALDQLSEESRAEVQRVLAARKAASAQEAAARMKLPDGTPIVPGRPLSFTVKATDQERKYASNENLQEILVTVSFPADFNPCKPCPVFFVNDATQGLHANIVGTYSSVGNAAGYVVLGAQAVGSNAGNKLGYWDVRGVATMRALQELQVNWPDIMRSAWYFGGASGGAKNCCYLAVYLYETFKIPPKGFFISASNEMKMLDAIKNYKSDKSVYRQAVFFVSNGQTDTIATPEQGKSVADEFERLHFGKVRFELHPGGHIMFKDHYREALEWFTQLRENPQSAPAGKQ